MKKFLPLLAILPTVALGGCFWGELAEVPAAHYGKIQTKNGFNPDVIPPSRFRLPYCWVYCDKLYLVESADFGIEEAFRGENALFMPKSDLVMPFDVRGTLAIKGDPVSLNAAFDRVSTEPLDSWGANAAGIIRKEALYKIYGEPIIRDVVRQVVAKYSIDEISSSREAVNAELTNALNKAFESTPILIRRVGLADVRFPELILKQKETAAQRRIAIEQEEAEKQIRLVKLSADLEAAKASRAIRREQAQAAAEENEILAKSATREYIEYRKLEVAEKMAENKSAVFFPFSALDEVGLSNKVFRANEDKRVTE